jgi:hypothetical protein
MSPALVSVGRWGGPPTGISRIPETRWSRRSPQRRSERLPLVADYQYVIVAAETSRHDRRRSRQEHPMKLIEKAILLAAAGAVGISAAALPALAADPATPPVQSSPASGHAWTGGSPWRLQASWRARCPSQVTDAPPHRPPRPQRCPADPTAAPACPNHGGCVVGQGRRQHDRGPAARPHQDGVQVPARRLPQSADRPAAGPTGPDETALRAAFVGSVATRARCLHGPRPSRDCPY